MKTWAEVDGLWQHMRLLDAPRDFNHPPDSNKQPAAAGKSITSSISNTTIINSFIRSYIALPASPQPANMHFTPTIVAAILAFTASNVLAIPVPQLAGEGAACNSVLSSTDNGIGYGVENAKDNTAATVSSTGAKLRLRQLAGEGAARNSVLSSTDNGVGYGVENAEDNTAATISSTGAKKRQADKIANGFGAVGDAAGAGAVADPVQADGDTVDGQLTGDATTAGAQAGTLEESSLEDAGSKVPKRQLDKIANGFGSIGNAAGAGAATTPVQNAGDNVDGTLTGDAADAGAQAGNTEASTLEGVGSAVPRL